MKGSSLSLRYSVAEQPQLHRPVRQDVGVRLDAVAVEFAVVFKERRLEARVQRWLPSLSSRRVGASMG
jgi:hypothetical protein